MSTGMIRASAVLPSRLLAQKNSSGIALRYGIHRSSLRCTTSTTRREECGGTSSTAAAAAAENCGVWRGSQQQQQYQQDRDLQQRQNNSKEEQLLSTAAKRWQRFWHQWNPHAPEPAEPGCSGSSRSDRAKDVVHVVLINLGCPSEPTYSSLWKYLRRELRLQRLPLSPLALLLCYTFSLDLHVGYAAAAASVSSVFFKRCNTAATVMQVCVHMLFLLLLLQSS